MAGIRTFAVLAAIAAAGLIASPPSRALAQDSKPDWREQNAYTLGVQAYLYAFPWSYMPNARWLRTESIDRQADRFDHIRHLEDAKHLSGGAPNNDTLYSRAWVYLKDEPVILTVPAIADRYYTMEIVDFMGDNFAYVGTRATETKSGNYAIVGPDWKGTLPDGVTALPPSSTPWATILGRTYVKDASDLDAAHKIQDQYKLTPLSQWGKAEVTPPKDAVVWPAFDPKADPLADWKTVNRAMIEVPPPAREADTLEQLARIGIGPGLDVEAQDASTKRGLARAAVDGKKIIAGAFTDGYAQKSRQRLELSAVLDGTPDANARLAGSRGPDARGLRRQRPHRGDLLQRLGRRRRQAADWQEPLHHPFRQGRRAQGQGVLVGDDVQSSVQSRRQSDRPLFGRRPHGDEARRGRRTDDLRAEGLAWRR